MVDTKETFTLKAGGTLTAAAGKDRWEADFAGEIIRARGVVGTAPTGAAILIDININGTTIYTTQSKRPTIAVGQTETTDPVETVSNDASTDSWTAQNPGDGYVQPHPSKGAVTWSDTPDVVQFQAGDTISLDVDQIGSTVAGADLEVTVEFIPE